MSYPHNKKKTFKPLILYDSSHPSASSSVTNNNTAYSSHHQEALIQEHRVKTKHMLEYNAQLWENEGRYFDISLSSSRKHSSDQSLSPQPTPQSSVKSLDHQFNQQNISSHSNRSSISHVDPSTHIDSHNQSAFAGNYRRDNRSPEMKKTSHRASTLEPQTQNSTPLPLYNHELLIRTPAEVPMTTYASTSPPCNHQQQDISYMTRSEEEEEDYFNVDDEPTVTSSREHDYTTQTTTTFINEPQFHHTYKPHIARKRRRGNLPKDVTEFLKRWLILHKKHPYPTEREKQKLADETGLMVNQISNWFINARRRILQPLLESESRQSQLADDNNDGSSSAVGVNVVGGSSNLAMYSSNRDFDNRINDMPDIGANNDNSNYHPHLHHNYNSNSLSSTSSLLLQQPSSSEDNLNTDPERVSHRDSVPPPWVLLPAKLPSMNVLEKDLEAFEPEK